MEEKIILDTIILTHLGRHCLVSLAQLCLPGINAVIKYSNSWVPELDKTAMAQLLLPDDIKPKIHQVWRIFLKTMEIGEEAISSLKIGDQESVDVVISDEFIRCVRSGNYRHANHFSDRLLFHTNHGRPDYLGTSFYLINSLQEYHMTREDQDELGRFSAMASVQHRFSILDQNYVLQLFRDLASTIPGVAKHKELRPSRIYVTHDVDIVTNLVLIEGKHAIRKFRPDLLLRTLTTYFLKGAPMGLFDRMMQINDAYDVKATFFWLIEQGHSDLKMSGRSIANADYRFDAPVLAKVRQKLLKHGHSVGLHKSLHASSFKEESTKFENPPCSNRNHFLYFRLPEHYDALEISGLKMDCSLGFPDRPGFRNSFGFPFCPFDMRQNRSYSFLEVPLNVMDATFDVYQEQSFGAAAEYIGDFLEQNKSGSLLSLLWHNNYFLPGKYPDAIKAYKSILAKVRDLGIRSVTEAEILAEYQNDPIPTSG